LRSGIVNFVNVGLSSSDDSLNHVIPFSFDDKESGHSLDFIGTSKLLGLININFQESDSGLLILLLYIGGNLLAWSAPSKLN
jgi:hypothetical protein